MNKKLSVVVLGAGFGGLELSTILSDEIGDQLELTLIDKSETFYFGFSKFDVMFGHKSAGEVLTKYKHIDKPGVKFLKDTVIGIDPSTRTVSTSGGLHIESDVLVIALGADYDIEATPGLSEVGNEFYTFAGAEALRKVLPSFAGGKVVVGVCATPFKCPPAPSEAALMMHNFLVKNGLRDRSEIHLVMPFGTPIPPSPDTSKALLEEFAEKNIQFVPKHIVKALDTEKKAAILDDGSLLPFDLFLGIPKHRAPKVVEDSGLAVNGWIPVDKTNLKTQYPGIYAIGDVNSVGTPKAGVFAEGAAKIAAANIISDFEKGQKPPHYKGDGICFVEFGDGRVGQVNVDFFSGPTPFGTYTVATEELAVDKTYFGSSRIKRWFGI